jgi:5,10-methylene-tetrahydrofolate dehydrogenase/methenyl tetrahydrofolate cyclohydrolase
VIVGERKDSQTYVRNKVKACVECGIMSTKLELAEGVTQAELIAHIRRLNDDKTVDGILVQVTFPQRC